MQVEKNERQAAREQLVTALLGGQSWQEVSKGPDVPVKRSMAYRLLRAVRIKGKIALQDGRHGHPSKLCAEVRTFLSEQCQQAPHTSGLMLQAALQERFQLNVSISQINRVRAELGLSNYLQRKPQAKKTQ
jgi:transposase